MSPTKPGPSEIPIIVCQACNQGPMIARTFNPHLLREKDGTDIEFECPHCGATTTVKLPGGDVEPGSGIQDP